MKKERKAGNRKKNEDTIACQSYPIKLNSHSKVKKLEDMYNTQQRFCIYLFHLFKLC